MIPRVQIIRSALMLRVLSWREYGAWDAEGQEPRD
jgi:hypothetical protein